MKWKQLFVALSLSLAGVNLMAQAAKTLPNAKPAKKQSIDVVDKHVQATDKTTIHKSSNPDRIDFIGVPWVNKDSK